jgi:hypothetical protein
MSTAITIIGLVLAAGSFVYSLVMSSKAKDAINNIPSKDGSLGDFSHTEMKEGVVIPIIYGVQFVTGNLVFWKAETVNQEYYQFCVRQVVGMGKLELVRVFKEGVNPNDNSVSFPTGVEDVNTYFSEHLMARTPPPASNVISDLNYYDGATENGTVLSDFNTTANNRYKLKLPDNGNYFSKFKKIANFYTEWLALPQGVTTIPTYRIIVRKRFTDQNNTPIGTGNLTGSGQVYDFDKRICGINPAFVIYDLLTNAIYGLGISESKCNLVSFQNAATYFDSKKYGLNFTISSIAKVRDIINQIQLWVNCYLIKDDNDLYILKIFKESDADSPVATILDSDEVEFTLRRKSWDETYNAFTGNYTDCFVEDRPSHVGTLNRFFDAGIYGDGSTRAVTIKNESNIALTGSIRHKMVDLTCFSSPHNASTRLQEIMLQESYPFATADLTTDLSFAHLRLGDVIRRDSDEYNISALFRIIDIDISQLDSNKLKFTLTQVKETLSDSHVVTQGGTQGEQTRSAPPPGIENVVFNPYEPVSEPLQATIYNKENIVAVWGTGQLQSGYLQYGTDFTIDSQNRVHLDEILFADDISNNSTGLMNIDIYEKDLPEES